MNLSRRRFLAGLGVALAAPAVIRTPGLLMPIKSIIEPQGFFGLATVKAEGALVEYDHVMLDFIGTDPVVINENLYREWNKIVGRAALVRRPPEMASVRDYETGIVWWRGSARATLFPEEA